MCVFRCTNVCAALPVIILMCDRVLNMGPHVLCLCVRRSLNKYDGVYMY